MNCFNHPSTPAIGTCKACSRGLCSECVTDLGHGLACKNSHEQRVQDIELIISKSATAYNDASKNLYIVPLFYVFMGLLFCGYSVYEGKAILSLFFAMGLGFLVFGIILLVRNRKIFSNKAE